MQEALLAIREALTVEEAVQGTQTIPDAALDARLTLEGC